MSVVSMVVGATTDDGATFVAKVDGGGPVRVAVADNGDMTNPVFTSSQAVDAQDVAKVSITGLDPATRFWWAVEDNGVLDTSGLVTDGTAGDYATTPDDASLDITGDLDVRADVTIADWTAAAPDGVRATLLGKWTGAQRSYFFGVEDNGRLSLFWSTTGANSVIRTSTVSVPITNGRLTVRATLDADNGAAGHDVTFYTATSISGPWTQLGSVITTAGTVTMFSGTAEGSVAAVDSGVGRPFAGTIHSAQVLNGINGTVVADPDFAAQAAGATSFADSTGKTWTVNGAAEIHIAVTGRFQTHPTLNSAASFTVAIGYCAGATPDFPGIDGGELAQNRVSNHPVFDTIRETDPLMVCHIGDLHYYDLGSGLHGIGGGGSLANYRSGYDDVLLQPRQHQLYREVALAYVWDDHDYGPNDSDGTLATKANAQDVYRERVPHYPLADADAIYQSWQIGRVLFVATDSRSDRDPNSDPQGPSKTMLGTAQKAWFENLLQTSNAEALVWLMPSVWLHPSGSDTWASFADERTELGEMLVEHGWADRTIMSCGDRHSAALDSGANNAWGGFPVMLSGSLDSTPSLGGVTGFYDVLPSEGGRNRYGTLDITDDGTTIQIVLSAWNGTTLLGQFLFVAGGLPPPPIFVPGSVAELLPGSNMVHVEARVITEFQTGVDPAGIELLLHDDSPGSVTLDGTADIRGIAEVNPIGVQDDGNSAFPRAKNTLLNPLTGNEIFIRYGIDLGTQILWTPLGYFRITDTDQAGAPFGVIRLACDDRMATLIDSRLMAPRVYPAFTTVGDVFDDLVREIYPLAIIAFSNGTDSATLGRQLIIEENRYQGLADIATGLGQIMFWDREGILRVETAPDEDEIVWEVRAGRDGVLAEANRNVTRDTVYNAWVVTGEGGDTATPARGVAVNADPSSLTRFGGPFGQVPRFFSSPFVTTNGQARAAAEAGVRRTLGAPYNVNFQAIPNPALEPFQAIRLTYRDGNRDRHVISTLTIPLGQEQTMSATTREQALVVIGDA